MKQPSYATPECEETLVWLWKTPEFSGAAYGLYGDPAPLSACDKCNCEQTRDVAIHDGQSTRRDCTNCGRFLGWPKWYTASSEARDE